MSISTRLFTLPPSRGRSFGTHLSSFESLRSKNLRVDTIESETVVTDNLLDRAGDPIVNTSYILLDETAAEPTPNAGEGRIWVRNDTPSKLIFTNDTGTDVPITPGLADVLAVDPDAGNLSITNISLLTFTAGIQIGNETASASASSPYSVAIGQGASSTAANNVVIGRGSSSANQYSVACGYNCDITLKSPNADGPGGVAVGANIASYGPGICIGRSIVNHAQNQDSANASIMIGQNITYAGVNGGVIAIGNSVTPGRNSVMVGNAATCLGGVYQVCIGNSAQTGSIGSVAIGNSAYSAKGGDLAGANYGVAIGGNASTNAYQGVALGFNATNTGANSVCLGSWSTSSAAQTVAIGGGAASGQGATASATGAIAVGNKTNAAHANSVALGAEVETRIADEFASRCVRIVRATLQTVGTNTATTILSYPTVAGDVLHVEGTVTAMKSDSSVSYMSAFERYHFRNKLGTLTQSAGTGTQTQDTTNVSYASSIGVSGTNIRVQVTGIAGHTVNWTCVLRIYGAGLV